MTGKRALVTGAGARLGQAMAIDLARRGYDVAVHYASSAAGAEETAHEIAGLGRRAVPLRADLLDDGEAAALFDAAVEGLGGPVTCLVNNASIFERDTIASATRDSWDRHIGSNLRAPFVLTQKLAAQGLEPLRDEDGEALAAGVIVNMVDQCVLKPTPDFTTYSLAKAGLWWLTRTSAQALAPAIRVNAIGPGPTLRAARQSPEHFASQRASTVLGRGANAQDITAALGYLLHAHAVTGQLLCVDGGRHLAWKTAEVRGVEQG